MKIKSPGFELHDVQIEHPHQSMSFRLLVQKPVNKYL